MKKRKASEDLSPQPDAQGTAPVELAEGEDPERPVRIYTDGEVLYGGGESAYRLRGRAAHGLVMPGSWDWFV